MDIKEKGIGQIAVKVASKGENENIGNPTCYCDWHEFGRFVGIWSITTAILFCALLLITTVSNSEKIVQDTIKSVDTINMMFSLVLSAFLEQIWSKTKDNGNWLYSFTLGMEGFLTIIGGMLFVSYSITKMTDNDNQLLQVSFGVNVGYVVFSILVVLAGFYSRAIRKKI